MVEIKNILDIEPLAEETYKEVMATVVEPQLAEMRKNGYMTFASGRKLHYEYYICPEAKGSIVISHGFTECAEKFREMDYYFLQAGYNVFALDHRGHGYSSREVDHVNVSHVEHFNDYVGDLNAYVENVVIPHSGDLPLYLYAHSMGGAIGALHLMQYPGVFEKAVLSSPMISPKTAGFPHWVTRTMTTFFRMIGKKKAMVFTETGFDPETTYERSHDTSKERFEYFFEKKKNTVEYQNCAASYGWVDESLKICPKLVDSKYCSKITAKVLLCQSAIDDSVELEPQEVFVSKVKDARLVKIPACKHEIYLSVNEAMVPYLKEIFSFLAE